MNSETEKEQLGIDALSILNALPGNYLILLPDAPRFTIAAVSDAYLAVTFTTRDAIIGRGIFEVFPDNPDNPEANGVKNLGQSLHYVLQHKKMHRMEDQRYDVMNPVKGSFEFKVWSPINKPVLDTAGNIQYLIHSVEDVSQRLQLDQALKAVEESKKIEQSEQRVRSLVESAPFPIAVYVGREMRIELANQSIMDIWGKGNDVVGKLYSEILPELDNQEVFAQLESVYNSGISFHAKHQHLDLIVNGKVRPYYFNYSFTPLFDAQGNVYGVMNTGADVTDLNLAKQKVEQSERNFRTMILQAPVAMCILLGPDHVVDIANDAMIKLWGKPEENVMHKPLFEGLPDAKEQGFEQLLSNVYQTGETFTANEHPVELLRNGMLEIVYQNFVYQPYRDSEGSILGIVAISVDVTEQVLARQKIEDLVVVRTMELAEANEALTISNQELKRTNSNLEDFAYAASHDMKEPIRKIHFFADRLKSELKDKLNETQSHLFERMENASSRMAILIDDLLAYSQATRGIADKEEIDLHKKVQIVLSDLELEIEQKKAMITVDGLPVIKGNRRQMQQLFQNLISNALKYSKAGTAPKVSIKSTLVKGDETGLVMPAEDGNKVYHLIEVADDGIGFEEKDADRIFNVFTRLHSSMEYRGTGVGLSIVRKVVENHEGFIWAESKPNEGARFKILLPSE